MAVLNALNEEVLSTKSNVVVDKYSDESGGINVTRRPHRRRGDPRRRTVCSSVRVFEVDVGYRYGDLDWGSLFPYKGESHCLRDVSCQFQAG